MRAKAYETEGLYTVHGDRQIAAADLRATDEGGCVYFSGAPGSYRLERTGELPSGGDEQDFWNTLRAEGR